MLIVLLGPPAAGKGTQAKKVVEFFGIPHISTGEILRQNISENTELGKIAARYINKGDLVPDEVIIAEVKERLEKPDCINGALLDGFPRTLNQARELDKITKVDIVIDIQVDEATLLKRVTSRQTCSQCGRTYVNKKDGVCQCGGKLYTRADDTQEAFINRLNNYRKLTLPITNYYAEQNKLVEIDGQGDAEQVFERIKEILNNINKGIGKSEH